MAVRLGRQNSGCLAIPASHCPGSILMIALVTGAEERPESASSVRRDDGRSNGHKRNGAPCNPPTGRIAGEGRPLLTARAAELFDVQSGHQQCREDGELGLSGGTVSATTLTKGGVSAGSSIQSGSLFRILATVSVIVSP